jgi:hypothetical protein
MTGGFFGFIRRCDARHARVCLARLWTAFVFSTSAGIGVLTMHGAWRMHRKATRYLKGLYHDET